MKLKWLSSCGKVELVSIYFCDVIYIGEILLWEGDNAGVTSADVIPRLQVTPAVTNTVTVFFVP